jgi:carbonic anhydrase
MRKKYGESIRSWITCLAVVGVSLLFVTTFSRADECNESWSYSGPGGPQNWGGIDAAYQLCSAGTWQSPIDIPTVIPPNGFMVFGREPIEFHYVSGDVDVVNDGHTIKVKMLQCGSYILYKHVRYDLKEFHFHNRSEETIDGKDADLDIHFVHQDSDGKLAVIALLLNKGTTNDALKPIWDKLPKECGDHNKVSLFDPTMLLPTSSNHWQYSGSLTTPPCTQGVTWLVLQYQTMLSADQLDAFMSIYRMNKRPLQPRNNRKIVWNRLTIP